MIAITFVIYVINTQNVRLVQQSLLKSLYFITIAFYIDHIWVYFKLSGENEENPGPQSKPCDSLSIFH